MAKYIKGIGFQWDAKKAIGIIHKEYPNYSLMQTESECGNGQNNWNSAEYTWSLIRQYIGNGANSYMYWNMILDDSGKSTWGWSQNMIISVNQRNRNCNIQSRVLFNETFKSFCVTRGTFIKNFRRR